jgi:hypothetical protein
MKKLFINLCVLRGMDSADGWPWQEVVVVFLAFYILMHDFEQPFHAREDNMLEMFADMSIILVMQAWPPPRLSRARAWPDPAA